MHHIVHVQLATEPCLWSFGCYPDHPSTNPIFNVLLVGGPGKSFLTFDSFLGTSKVSVRNSIMNAIQYSRKTEFWHSVWPFSDFHTRYRVLWSVHGKYLWTHRIFSSLNWFRTLCSLVCRNYSCLQSIGYINIKFWMCTISFWHCLHFWLQGLYDKPLAFQWEVPLPETCKRVGSASADIFSACFSCWCPYSSSPSTQQINANWIISRNNQYVLIFSLVYQFFL